jgi:hypothetical protein
MTRTLVLALPTLLLTVSLAPAQSYSYSSRPQGYLRRETAPSERPPTQAMRDVGTPQYVESGKLASDDYFARAGGTRAAYIRRLYFDVVGREPLPAEINYWVGRLRYETRRDVAYRLLRFHPQNVGGMTPVPPNYDPGFFPDPASQTFPDPGGPYFRSPYFDNYGNNRSLRAFYLGAQG